MCVCVCVCAQFQIFAHSLSDMRRRQGTLELVMEILSRVTRCVCEKVAQNVAQQVLC
jgi:hypothetical protein